MELSESFLTCYNENPNDPRKKVSKACTSCREKKVKCEGTEPCERCLKHGIECVYQQKATKPNTGIESHASRLKKLGKMLEQLSAWLDHKDGCQRRTDSQPKTESISVNTVGKANYLPDSCLRTDRVPSVLMAQDGPWILEEIRPKQEIYNTDPIQTHLLVFYFDYIDPLLPILHKDSFYSQLQTGQEVSSLLLNAMYCVSSRWDMMSVHHSQPRGWAYYQRALFLLENQKESQLSTIQALLLLLKYNEHVRRPGFLWRTRYYFRMAIRMCKDIGLEHKISLEKVSPAYAIELEKRKRTFWAVYCYDVMMSIEYQTPFHFNLECEEMDDPRMLYGEDPKKIIHFILLTKIVSCQAQITGFLRKKFDPRSTVTNFLTDWNEAEATVQLSHQLKKSITTVFSLIQPPQQDCMSYAVCFLSLACYYAIITLHRPFAYRKGGSESYENYCLEAAFHIKRVILIILKSEATEDMYCSLRGIPQIVHYLSAAITVFKEAGRQDELNTLLPIVYHLASISPVTEMPIITTRTENRSTIYDEIQNLDFQVSQHIPHIPDSMSYLDLLNN